MSYAECVKSFLYNERALYISGKLTGEEYEAVIDSFRGFIINNGWGEEFNVR